MRFCPTCDNILIPRKRSFICRICGEKFEVDSKLDDFMIVRVIQHDDRDDGSNNCKRRIKKGYNNSPRKKSF